MTTPALVTGDDFLVPVTLTIDDAAFDMSGATSVLARVVSADHAQALTAEVAQSSGASGASWSAALVVVAFAAADTAAISATGLANIEIQVTLGGKKSTWFVPIEIVRGQIA